jgi:hypothetical protein
MRVLKKEPFDLLKGRGLEEREEGMEEAQDLGLGLGGQERQGGWPPSGRRPAARRELESPLRVATVPNQVRLREVRCGLS